MFSDSERLGIAAFGAAFIGLAAHALAPVANTIGRLRPVSTYNQQRTMALETAGALGVGLFVGDKSKTAEKLSEQIDGYCKQSSRPACRLQASWHVKLTALERDTSVALAEAPRDRARKSEQKPFLGLVRELEGTMFHMAWTDRWEALPKPPAFAAARPGT